MTSESSRHPNITFAHITFHHITIALKLYIDYFVENIEQDSPGSIIEGSRLLITRYVS